MKRTYTQLDMITKYFGLRNQGRTVDGKLLRLKRDILLLESFMEHHQCACGERPKVMDELLIEWIEKHMRLLGLLCTWMYG